MIDDDAPLEVTGVDGRRFSVRTVRRGMRYGLNDVLTHDRDDPLIEFYDASQSAEKFGPRGQFVSRYFASTLAGHVGGLSLHGGVAVWTVPAAEMAAVVAWARRIARSSRAS